MSKQLRFWGASDDLIKCSYTNADGDVFTSEACKVEGGASIDVARRDGAGIRVIMRYAGVWGAQLEPLLEGNPIPDHWDVGIGLKEFEYSIDVRLDIGQDTVTLRGSGIESTDLPHHLTPDL